MRPPNVNEAYALGLDGRSDDRFSGPLQRLLYIQASPNLSALRGPELAALAQHCRERFFPEGSVIYEGSEPVTRAHILVEGGVDLVHDGVVQRTVQAPYAVGMIPMFAGKSAHGVANADTLALEITRAQLFEAMEENFAVLHSAIVRMLRDVNDVQRFLDVRGHMARTEPEEVPYPVDDLDMVQRIGLLRRGFYEDTNLEPIVELARRGEELRAEDGDVLWTQGDPGGWGLHVVHGVIRCHEESGVRDFRMGPGSVVGYIDAHAANPRAYTATVEGRLVAFKGTTETFFDVLEDNFELGMGFLSALSTALVGLYEKVAEIEGAAPSQSGTSLIA